MFTQNLQNVRSQFQQVMDEEAGKNVLVKDVFDALENLANGKYSTLTEMFQSNSFNSQNVVYRSVATMLDNLGTPVTSVTKRTGAKKKQGTQFALDLLNKQGLKIETKKRVKKTA